MIIGILLFIITKINLHTILMRRFVRQIKVKKIKSEKEVKQGKQLPQFQFNVLKFLLDA